LNKIANACAPGAELVAGQVRNFSPTHDEIISNQNLSAKGLMCWNKSVKFVQPGVWMKRELLHRCGGIDERLHFSFDWDLMIRYLECFPTVKYLEHLLVHFRLHEQSKTVSSQHLFQEEDRLIIQKIAPDIKFKTLH